MLGILDISESAQKLKWEGTYVDPKEPGSLKGLVNIQYGRSVEFWYFQAFKWTQKRTMTPMPTEIDENMFFTP